MPKPTTLRRNTSSTHHALNRNGKLRLLPELVAGQVAHEQQGQDQDRGRLAGEHEEDHRSRRSYTRRRADDDQGEALRGDRAHDPRAAGDDRRGAARDVARWATASTRCAQSGEHEALAREIKFPVTDMNGWQTAYGYAGGDFRGPLPRLGGEAPRRPRRRADPFTDGREHALLRAGPTRTSTASWSSTRSPGASSSGQPGAHQADPARSRAAAVRGHGRHRRPARRPTRWSRRPRPRTPSTTPATTPASA